MTQGGVRDEQMHLTRMRIAHRVADANGCVSDFALAIERSNACASRWLKVEAPRLHEQMRRNGYDRNIGLGRPSMAPLDRLKMVRGVLAEGGDIGDAARRLGLTSITVERLLKRWAPEALLPTGRWFVGGIDMAIADLDHEPEHAA